MTDPASVKAKLDSLADLANSPIARLDRLLANSPIQQMMRVMEDAPIQRLSRELEHQSVDRLALEIGNAHRFPGLWGQGPAILASLAQTEALQRKLLLPEAIDLLARFPQQDWANARALGLAVLPPAGAISSISAQLARMIGPFQAGLVSVSAWECALAARMAAVDTAWAFPDHLGPSMLGFARLSRLSDAVHTAEPYAEPVGELVADELGVGAETDQSDEPIARDMAAIEAGLRPELIAFPSEAYASVLTAVGFELHFKGLPVPQASEAPDPGAAFDPMHSLVLTQIEQRLRQFVETRLQALNGAKWIKQRVAESVRKRWMDRQAEERAAGRPVYSSIQYADFMDLADVIGQRNNWHDVFGATFGNRDDFTLSLRRLHPVRKAVAHGRPLGRADVLTLLSEATRIFRALGIQVLRQSSF
jgi:hypothetical protein